MYAHGHRETKYAPALKYSPDSVTTTPVDSTPAPETTTSAPAGPTSTQGSGSTTTTTTTTTTKATAWLVGGVKFSHGKLAATVACGGTEGTCHVLLEVSVGGKAGMDVPVTVAVGEKKTVKVKPSKALTKAMDAHPKAKLSVRLVAPEGKAKKVKVG